MYGCENQTKGCLLVTASRIGGGLSISADAINKRLLMSANRIGEGLDVSASRIGGVSASAYRIGEGLKITCGLVCTVNESIKILEVQPDIIFLTPENGWSADINIISNVEWIIE